MNQENIKQLIELFSSLGASGKEAFLYFVGLRVLEMVLWFGCIAFVAILIYRLINRCMSESQCETAIIKLRNNANIGYGSYLHKEEIQATLDHYLSKK